VNKNELTSKKQKMHPLMCWDIVMSESSRRICKRLLSNAKSNQQGSEVKIDFEVTAEIDWIDRLYRVGVSLEKGSA
jgi:hypothetical protein